MEIKEIIINDFIEKKKDLEFNKKVALESCIGRLNATKEEYFSQYKQKEKEINKDIKRFERQIKEVVDEINQLKEKIRFIEKVVRMDRK